MKFTGKYNRQYIGILAGFIIPLLTHIISLCVFPNILLFLLFNRLDMLRATRGVLAITIFWAVLVFAVKFLL